MDTTVFTCEVGIIAVAVEVVYAVDVVGGVTLTDIIVEKVVVAEDEIIVGVVVRAELVNVESAVVVAVKEAEIEERTDAELVELTTVFVVVVDSIED
ncbi:MAG TPA: hypothetical protein VK503_01680 [Candidatus Bathyarchaeia archaeon]|nr:hypothetical protein [Candidatus Bathyarchaeia archaeon]